MLLSTTLLFATSSLAFLLPEINTKDQPKSEFLPSFIETSGQTVNLDCSNCPFALSTQRNGAHEWTNDVESVLKMEFKADGKALQLNGVPFYPISQPIPPPTLFVSQSKKDGQSSNMEGYDGNLRLSYSMEYDEKKFADNSLVTVLMTVMGLDGQMIKVDNIEVTAIKEDDGTVCSFQIFLLQSMKLTLSSSYFTPLRPSPSLQTPQTPNVRLFCAAFLPR